MPFDPSIIMGVRPLEVPNQLAQYGQLMQIQAAQRQNEVSQMQMDELRRDREGMQKFQADLVAKGGNPDLNEYAAMLLQSGNAAHQKMGIELKQKLMQQAQFEKIMGAGTPAAPVAPAPAGALGSGTYGALPAPANALAPAAAPTNALAAPTSNVAALRQKRDALLAMGTQQSIAAANSINEDIKALSVQHVAAPGSIIYDANGKLIASTPERTDTDLIRNYKAWVAQGGKGDILAYQKAISEAGRPPVQPQPPVAVLDASGKQIYVTREEALRGRMTPASSTRGVQGLTDTQNEALYGPNGAVTLGRLDPYKVNGRTAKILADAYILNPDTDMNALASNAGLMRNAPYMARAQTTEMLPEILSNVVTAGKKVNYSDAKFIGAVEQFAKGQMNDPDFISYMTQRNDALLTIAGVMRGNGATDQAHRAEIEAASPTMSPAALDAWLKAQMTALAPRLKQAGKVTRTPGAAPAAVPAAGGWGKAVAE